MQDTNAMAMPAATEIKPRTLWYWIAAGVAALGVGLGLGLMALSFSMAADQLKLSGPKYGDGQAVVRSFTVTPASGIYTTARRDDSGMDYGCTVTDANGTGVNLVHPTQHISGDVGDDRYSLVYQAQVPRAGSYHTSCYGAGKFTTGRGGNFGAYGTWRLVGGLSGVLIPVIGILVGAAIAVMTGRRRGAAKQALATAAAGEGGQYTPAPPPADPADPADPAK